MSKVENRHDFVREEDHRVSREASAALAMAEERRHTVLTSTAQTKNRHTQTNTVAAKVGGLRKGGGTEKKWNSCMLCPPTEQSMGRYYP